VYVCRCEDQKQLDEMLGGLFDDFDLDSVYREEERNRKRGRGKRY
jgi:hypothetical protein